MSEEDDTITPETDDELRARLRAFAEAVKEHTDTEAALRRVPRRSRPPTVRLLAIAACVLAVVALAAVITAERQSVHTTDPSNSSTQTTYCPSTTHPRAITQGAQMKHRFAVPVASAATAILLLSGCDDDSSTTPTQTDGPTTVAKGENVHFVASTPGHLGDQTMDITAVENDGKVTGEAQFSPSGLRLDLKCAYTTDARLILIGGEATADAGDGSAEGDRVAVIIREGGADPDEVVLWFEQPLPDGYVAAESCEEFLNGISDDELDEEAPFTEVADGDDIETG